MAALVSKVLESRLQKSSGTQTHAFPRKALQVETKKGAGAGGKEKRPTWAYSLSQFCGEGAALLSSAPPEPNMKLAPELHTSAVRCLTMARRGAAPAGAGSGALVKAQLGNSNRKKTWRGPWEMLSSGAE